MKVCRIRTSQFPTGTDSQEAAHPQTYTYHKNRSNWQGFGTHTLEGESSCYLVEQDGGGCPRGYSAGEYPAKRHWDTTTLYVG